MEEARDRTETDVIADLEELAQSPGYLFSFCFLVWCEFAVMSPDDLLDRNPFEHHNSQELSFILGLMVKLPIEVGEIPSEETIKGHVGRTNVLMEELQQTKTAHGSSVGPSLQDAIGKQHDSGRRMVEPIFYGGEGAYSQQFLEGTHRRYWRDRVWFSQYLGMELDTMVHMCERAVDSVRQVSEREIPVDFRTACGELLELFSLDDAIVAQGNPVNWQTFLEHFSLEPGTVNEQLTSIGAHNEVLVRPIVKLKGKYFMPLSFNLARAAYTNPFYWMLQDEGYRVVAENNRGRTTEDITEDLLQRSFGAGNVHRNVKIKRHGTDVTDVDVLVLYRNKALIVQAKSKKLTELSKAGDDSRLREDFAKAIQSAYDQGVVAQRGLYDSTNTLIAADGRQIECSEHINESYILCVTADHYPAVVTQMATYLEKGVDAPRAVACSVLALETLVDFLPHPSDFLYYIRQRVQLSENSIAASELDYLGWHMEFGLPCLPDQAFLISNSLDSTIDAAVLTRRLEEDSGVKVSVARPKWRNNSLSLIAEHLCLSSEPGMIDAVFLLFDLMTALPGSKTTEIEEGIRRLKFAIRKDGKLHNLSWPSSLNRRGLSLVCYPDFTFMVQHLPHFSACRKYTAYADEWLSLGFVAGSTMPFDWAFYLGEPWQDDAELADMAREILKGGTVVGGTGAKKKQGRNEPCPCGSGKKFKKCHGLGPVGTSSP